MSAFETRNFWRLRNLRHNTLSVMYRHRATV